MADQQDTTLAQVVSDRLFEVPDYQRPYAWQRKQLDDLWNDLDLLGPTAQHYAGTLVLRNVTGTPGTLPVTSMDDEGTVLRHTEVVDGQQRLTTCVILLDRMRRALMTIDDDRASKTADKLRTTFGVVSIDNAKRPKLSLGSDLNDFWIHSILGSDTAPGHTTTSGHARLRAAAEFFDTKIAEVIAGVDAETKLRRLRDLQGRVTNGLRFVVYEVSSAAEVGTIFETLNERGRGLTDLEKTKNYLLYLSRLITDARGEQLAQYVNTRWSEIFAHLAALPAEMDDPLLRAHWLATVDPDPRNWNGTASIKAKFDRSQYVSTQTTLIPNTRTAVDQDQAWDKLVADVKAYVRTLRDCSFFVRESLDPAAHFAEFSSDGDRARRATSALIRSGVTALYRPLFLACRLTHPTDGAAYADLVELAEKYSARVFVIAQRRANAGQSRLYRLAHELYSGGKSPAEVITEMTATLWNYAPDSRLEAVLGSTSEDWYVRQGHKYFLYEYELSLLSPGEASPPPLDAFTKTATGKQRTTEHILPQNPSSSPVGDCWWTEFTEEQHRAMMHALGNLVLTLDNSSYSNHCFVTKRGTPIGPGVAASICYAQGKLHQERELAAETSWTPAAIAARQERLKVWALRRWSVTPPEGGLNADLDDVLEDEGSGEDTALDLPQGGEPSD
jgi:hypothetical protein